MSEDTLEYATTQPKRVETSFSGFVPIFDYVLQFYKDPITALVFGRRWQYCSMEDGVCRASLAKIAGDLCIDEATVMRHTEKLVIDGFLIDTTPERRNRPHVYKDGGMVYMKNSMSAHIAQSNVGNSGIAQSNAHIAQSNAGIAQSQLIKQYNTNIKQENNVDFDVDSELDTNTQKSNILGIEASIYQNRPTTQEDIDSGQRATTIALIAFETAFKVTNGLITWYSPKSGWKELRACLTAAYKDDRECFGKYVEWSKDPNGGKFGKSFTVNQLRRDPHGFIVSWSLFVADTTETKSENPKVRIIK